jgi:hypothetical protein|tara:strand:+ start:716 stop:913 length:198 start_codon:yes stop_codon:yes gene_type:complete
VCLSHTNLLTYYKVNFALIQHYRYSLQDIESMIPWEREVYLSLLEQHVEELEAQRRDSPESIANL